MFLPKGCENLDSWVGILASDPEAYTVFAPVLDAIIKDCHKVEELNHPQSDFGVDKIDFDELDPEGSMIISTRVRVGRNHDSYGFPPVLSREVSDSCDVEVNLKKGKKEHISKVLQRSLFLLVHVEFIG